MDIHPTRRATLMRPSFVWLHFDNILRRAIKVAAASGGKWYNGLTSRFDDNIIIIDTGFDPLYNSPLTWPVRPWATTTLRAPPPPPTTYPQQLFFKLWYVQKMKWDVNSKKIGTNLYILTPYRGVPPNLSKIRGLRKRLSSLFYQSTHAIYHIKGD